MKKMKWIYAALIGIAFVSFSTLTIAEETKRAWMTSACYKFNLTAWDKFSEKAYLAKYTITSGSGRAFVAQKNATGHNSAMVVFPDDFNDAKLNVPASVDCFDGEKYKWAIYVNGVLRDSGTIAFTRDKRR